MQPDAASRPRDRGHFESCIITNVVSIYRRGAADAQLVGALTARMFWHTGLFHGIITRIARRTCPYDAINCQLSVSSEVSQRRRVTLCLVFE
jgi:hypothetical protein